MRCGSGDRLPASHFGEADGTGLGGRPRGGRRRRVPPCGGRPARRNGVDQRRHLPYNRDEAFEDTIRSFLEIPLGGDRARTAADGQQLHRSHEEIGENVRRRGYPWIRYGERTRAGATPTRRNRAIRETRETSWLSSTTTLLLSGMVEGDGLRFRNAARNSCVGGRVVPHFETGRPPWADDECSGSTGSPGTGIGSGRSWPPEIPIGCNMAFRRTVFEKDRRFPRRLGRKPGDPAFGDADHFLLRMTKAGIKTAYSPEAGVSHRVPAARATRDWVVNRFLLGGDLRGGHDAAGDEPLSRYALSRMAYWAMRSVIRQWRDLPCLLNGTRTAGERKGPRLPAGLRLPQARPRSGRWRRAVLRAGL
jgi:hypothetical protein